MKAEGRFALVLAAGAARRFGGGKLTADWKGEPLILSAVRAALASEVEAVFVVLGAEAQVVEASLEAIDDVRLKRIYAADWDLGQSASLAAGLSALPDRARCVVVFLGDMPLVGSKTANQVLAALEAGALAARPQTPNGPGHPVAFSHLLFERLKIQTGDQGARNLLTELKEAVVLIATSEPGDAFDVDRVEDLQVSSDDRDEAVT
ncbi:hypothetical protein LTR94_028772, partial [Friedmanniomyces endolithicus]